MNRYDNYDQLLQPGDLIVFTSSKMPQLFIGKIHSITPKGRLRVFGWDDENQQWKTVAAVTSCYKVVKIIEFPKRAT